VLATTRMKGGRAMARKYDTSTYKKLLPHFMGEADSLCRELVDGEILP